MIPKDIQLMLSDHEYFKRIGNEHSIRTRLDALAISADSELGQFYLHYSPTNIFNPHVGEEFEDIELPVLDGATPVENPPEETPIAETTKYLRETWGIPEGLICLTSVQGTAAYLYELTSGAVYDFELEQFSALKTGTLLPRWNSFFEFLRWYLTFHPTKEAKY